MKGDKTMKLHEVKVGEIFTVAGVEFIKFTDGAEVVAVAKDTLFNSRFGDNGDFAASDIKQRLEAGLLPKIEAEVGAENVLAFETDMTALDGTKPFENVRSKISLATLDFYRQNRALFAKYNPREWWWLATVDSEEYKNVILCVSRRGDINCINYDIDYGGVRPVLRFVSSIYVSCEG